MHPVAITRASDLQYHPRPPPRNAGGDHVWAGGAVGVHVVPAFPAQAKHQPVVWLRVLGTERLFSAKPHPRLQVKNASSSRSWFMTIATLIHEKLDLCYPGGATYPRPGLSSTNPQVWAIPLNAIMERHIIQAFSSPLHHVLPLPHRPHHLIHHPDRVAVLMVITVAWPANSLKFIGPRCPANLASQVTFWVLHLQHYGFGKHPRCLTSQRLDNSFQASRIHLSQSTQLDIQPSDPTTLNLK